MNLIEERNSWREVFEREGKCGSYILEEYKEHRNDNTFRMSKTVEHLCEYILYLEDKVNGLEGI